MTICWAGANGCKDGPMGHDAGCDHGELKLSLQLAAAHAPWLRTIFILTNSPAAEPTWLKSHAYPIKAVVVDRCKLFPNPHDCPTFSTMACQTVEHLTPGLSEHYISSEDDMFMAKRLTYLDLFTHDGKPLIFRKLDYLARPVSVYSNPKAFKTPQKLGNTGFWHVPQPMLRSFAASMEANFSSFFNFVRSHKHRRGVSEDFTLIYPLYLYNRGIGKVDTEAQDSACYSVGAVRNSINKQQKIVNANNIKTNAEWAQIAQLLEGTIPLTSNKVAASTLSERAE
eukprot:TRINITY_DN2753_c1_g1_i2.p1 TRINITY_DN2753_c1_g1~~TRINITY_DN2753_c1_g1_i2.p1  ORF type:complete len:283 (-),score=30.92 TRINITY_DN2753_c1_g1_i2:161-1009(-)